MPISYMDLFALFYKVARQMKRYIYLVIVLGLIFVFSLFSKKKCMCYKY